EPGQGAPRPRTSPATTLCSPRAPEPGQGAPRPRTSPATTLCSPRAPEPGQGAPRPKTSPATTLCSPRAPEPGEGAPRPNMKETHEDDTKALDRRGGGGAGDGGRTDLARGGAGSHQVRVLGPADIAHRV